MSCTKQNVKSPAVIRDAMRGFAGWLLVAWLLVTSAIPGFSWPAVYPGGTTLYKPDKAYNGYVLYCPISVGGGHSEIYLINMSGTVVHQWQLPFAALSAKLLPDGHLLAIGYNTKQTPTRPGGTRYRIGGAAGWLVELDWNGAAVFRHEDLNMHHDAVKLPNGNYMYLAWEPVPKERVKRVRGGLRGAEFADGTMFNDDVVEINPQGKVVWTWHANEHLDPAIDIIGPLYKRQEWLHANSLSLISRDRVLLSSRSTDSILIVDRKSGAITFRWGNSSAFNRATGQVEYAGGSDHLGGPHDAREIPDGYPGAGHLTCYNNRMNTGDFLFSQAIEIDPASRRVVWKTPINLLGRKQFSDFLGSTQRLPNGNMLICTGSDGQFMQMTRDMEVVWEYVNPHIPSPHFQGAVLKIECYAPDYCSQFKALPSAQGEPIIPAANASIQVVSNQPALPAKEHPDIIPLPLAVGVIAALCVLFFWSHTRRKK